MKLSTILLTIFASNTLYAQNGAVEKQQTFWQGDESLSACETCGYSYPATVNLQCGYGVALRGSYLYWFAGEEGLDLATTVLFNTATNTAVAPSTGGSVVRQKFDYGSGFKVGLSWITCWDNWTWNADYTRYHHDTKFTRQADPQTGGVGGLYLTDWFYQTSAGIQQGVVSGNFTSKWDLDLDWIDVTLERPYYSGRSFTLNPFFGLRAALINQTVNLSVGNVLNFSPPQSTVSSNNNSNSWGIGPRAGAAARYLLGRQIRIEGSAGASLLYTKYTKISHSEGTLTAGGSGIGYSSNGQSDLRPYLEGNLGLGWGSYCCNKRYHFDFNATYDFNYLWAQNMIRYLNDLNVIGTGASAGSLYLHGLTVNGSFDF